jgi:Mrp family chromosome partitioning ATPase/uncharacterized protein involved in exopolysaccharide biosynthesis
MMIDIPNIPDTSSEQVAPRAAVATNPPVLADKLDLWRTAHRALRGRYRIALVLAISGAIAGALTGWIYGKRIYCATGLVRIASTLPAMIKQTDQNQPMAMFDGFIQAQQEVMTSREMIEAALGSEPWRRVEAATHISCAEQFAANLKVETRPRSDYLRVTFKHRDAEVASAGVQSIITAYQEKYEREQGRFESQRMDELKCCRSSLTAEVQNLESDIDQIRKKHLAAELETLYSAIGERAKKLHIALAEVQSARAGGPGVVQQTSRLPGETVSDEKLRAYAADQTRAESQLEQARTRGLGPAHPLIVSLEAAVEKARRHVESFTQESDMRRAGRDTEPPLSLPERETNLQQLIETTESELQELAVQRELVTDLKDKLAESRLSLAETERRIDVLTTEAFSGSRLTIVNRGEKPMTALLENRTKFAGAGALAGAVAPIFLFILGTMVQRRYRFTDELAQDLSARVPFVAALPDVNRAGVIVKAAARCVHQLRARIQPRGYSDVSPCGSRTYLITSASAGEGKSSLSLALGMSFAAAGFRTLVIDADLTSRGLSSEANAKEASGLIEAVAGGKMVLRRLRPGLSLMASGQGHSYDALTLAPDGLMKVLAVMRAKFDVVLIDSDPILTGVTASIIAPQADGVILTITRGQQQPLVHSAIRQLEMLGSRLLGIVFNRAAASDLQGLLNEQMRSPAAEEPLPLVKEKRFGPLVRAVLSSLIRSRGDDLELSPDGLEPALTDTTNCNQAHFAETA